MKRLILSTFLTCFVIFQLYADWKIVINTKTSEGTEYSSTFYVKNGVLKQETPEMDVIIDLNKNKIIYKMERSSWE